MSEMTSQDGATVYDWGTSPDEMPSLNASVLHAIAGQVNAELRASHQYLAMAAFCEQRKYPGAARWLKHQSMEERKHALKLLEFVLARNAPVELEEMPAPTVEFKDIADVFVGALLQEQQTSAQINDLCELAFASKAFSEMAALQWFLTEQVEEEQTARRWVSRFQRVGNDAGALLDLDRELATRSSSD
ncbi:MAG TPA: ferritin [Vicinamibacterales bacterium]|nr:ferritin [Vicinamibacterales bacterium]